jgi:hypothetical protein
MIDRLRPALYRLARLRKMPQGVRQLVERPPRLRERS